MDKSMKEKASNVSKMTVVDWDGYEGLAENMYGDSYRFSLDEVDEIDKDHIRVGVAIYMPENGMIVLRNKNLSHYESEEGEE